MSTWPRCGTNWAAPGSCRRSAASATGWGDKWRHEAPPRRRVRAPDGWSERRIGSHLASERHFRSARTIGSVSVRRRLLIVLSAFALAAVAGFAVPLLQSTAAGRTQEF